MNQNLNKALFLDRDGIINEDIGYPHRPDQIVFTPHIFDITRIAAEKGYLNIVITNQAGIAKGLFSESDVEALHVWMKEQFQKEKCPISAFYYCPYHPKAVIEKYRIDSDCRKPAPGMILKAINDFQLDVEKSILIGDKESDRINLKGLRSLIVKSKYCTDNYDIKDIRDILNYL